MFAVNVFLIELKTINSYFYFLLNILSFSSIGFPFQKRFKFPTTIFTLNAYSAIVIFGLDAP